MLGEEFGSKYVRKQFFFEKKNQQLLLILRFASLCAVAEQLGDFGALHQ
jgi:hypothetical protein